MNGRETCAKRRAIKRIIQGSRRQEKKTTNKKEHSDSSNEEKMRVNQPRIYNRYIKVWHINIYNMSVYEYNKTEKKYII